MWIVFEHRQLTLLVPNVQEGAHDASHHENNQQQQQNGSETESRHADHRAELFLRELQWLILSGVAQTEIDITGTENSNDFRYSNVLFAVINRDIATEAAKVTLLTRERCRVRDLSIAGRCVMIFLSALLGALVPGITSGILKNCGAQLYFIISTAVQR